MTRRHLTEPSAQSLATPHQLLQDAQELMWRYRTDQAHCRRVQQFALQLFAWTIGQRLTETETAPWSIRLVLGCLLHDLGHYIADKGHHRHSRYLILNAPQTAAWDAGLRTDVAALAFTHRKLAKSSWEKTYFRQSKELFQLAAILRVADGLDRSHRPGVQIHGHRREDGHFLLELGGLQPEDELHLATQKADAWEKAFAESISFHVKSQLSENPDSLVDHR